LHVPAQHHICLEVYMNARKRAPPHLQPNASPAKLTTGAPLCEQASVRCKHSVRALRGAAKCEAALGTWGAGREQHGCEAAERSVNILQQQGGVWPTVLLCCFKVASASSLLSLRELRYL